MNKSYFKQLLTIFLTLIFSMFLFYFFISLTVVKSSLLAEAKAKQLDMTSLVANYISKESLGSSKLLNEKLENLTWQIPIRITVIDKEGEVVGDTDKNIAFLDNHKDRPELLQALSNGSGSSLRFSASLSKTMLYSCVYLKEYALFVRTAQSAEHITDDLVKIYKQIFLFFMIVVILAFLSAFIIARRLSQSLKSMREVAKEYSKGNFTPEVDPQGPRELLSLARSINTMGRQLEDKINLVIFQKNELKAMLDSMREPVILLNNRLELRAMNPAAEQLLENSDLIYTGKGILQVFPWLELCEISEEVLDTQESQERVLFYPRDKRYFQTNALPLRGEIEEQFSILLVLNDISQIKELDKMRKDFVSNVSHELKTPITSLIGYIETLKDGGINYREKALEFLNIMERQAYNLNNIIDDLLSLSRLEEGREEGGYDIEKKAFNIARLCQNLIQGLRPQADEKQISIKLFCPDDLTTIGHALLIEQGLSNLLINAIKYGFEGGIIYLRIRKDLGHILIEVEDSGPGIPLEDQKRIFERFYRVNKDRSRHMGGTGLGLSIVKHIILLHGGYVECQEAPSLGGALFRLVIPIIEK